MQRLVRYFTEGIENKPIAHTVGVEVETSFVRMENVPKGSGSWYASKKPKPITLAQSQELFKQFLKRNFWWKITKRKGELVTEISDNEGNKLLYELGRQNIEISAAPRPLSETIDCIQNLENKLSSFLSATDAKALLDPQNHR